MLLADTAGEAGTLSFFLPWSTFAGDVPHRGKEPFFSQESNMICLRGIL